MPTYHVYGLTVDSDVEFPFLEPIRADEPTRTAARRTHRVRIRRGAVTETPTAEPDDGRIHRTTTGLYATFSGVGTLHAEGGQTLVVDADAGGAPRLLRQFVLGQGFRMLLHQRGYLVLHASATLVDGHAVAFLGDSGRGKSTIAAACDAAGYPLVTDDVLAVDPETGTVRPGVPAVKLAHSTVKEIYSELKDVFSDVDSVCNERTTTGDGRTRQYRPVSRETPADSIPLAGLHVITDGPTVRTSPVSPAARPYLVMCGSAAIYESGDEPAVERHFTDCLQLCQSVPVKRLERPSRMSTLPTLVSEVTANREPTDASAGRGDDGREGRQW